MPNLLLIHGNGGARARFRPFLDLLEQKGPASLQAVVPELPGFEGRPLPPGDGSWGPFIEALQSAVYAKKDEPWILYGHGIGGSLLLEWAARGWLLPDGSQFQPQHIILHACIGASLEHRFFPKLMKPRPVRRLMQQLIAWPALQPLWERRLFQNPANIPATLRRQFFRDYQTCAAFSVFFDLITPSWYRKVQQKVKKERFYFIWGEQERVVASKYLTYWQQGFPNATFDIIPGWDHFPMLDHPEAFYEKIISVILSVDGSWLPRQATDNHRTTATNTNFTSPPNDQAPAT
ncbi:MAG: alpha/beta hydrolase [Phaeodactylibacter sp.]|nr:alpha/beta hydrolase [Phaeodactylibacter sp.]MCB9299283.1 alpha/beta hydrolase [Lewinellaceae bacterium]HQU60364.1 alpha/beta hydrolase [Saprospiraceae bacterium]